MRLRRGQTRIFRVRVFPQESLTEQAGSIFSSVQQLQLLQAVAKLGIPTSFPMTTRNCFALASTALIRFGSIAKRTGFLPLLLSLQLNWSAAGSPIDQVSYQPIQAPNACLPDAIGFQNAYEISQRMRHTGSWSRVLMVHRRGSGMVPAHAFCVFALEGKLWAYDQAAGCRRVWISVEERTDAMKVGRMLLPGQFDHALWIDQTF
jgi:hypothetical protein